MASTGRKDHLMQLQKPDFRQENPAAMQDESVATAKELSTLRLATVTAPMKQQEIVDLDGTDITNRTEGTGFMKTVQPDNYPPANRHGEEPFFVGYQSTSGADDETRPREYHSSRAMDYHGGAASHRDYPEYHGCSANLTSPERLAQHRAALGHPEKCFVSYCPRSDGITFQNTTIFYGCGWPWERVHSAAARFGPQCRHCLFPPCETCTESRNIGLNFGSATSDAKTISHHTAHQAASNNSTRGSGLSQQQHIPCCSNYYQRCGHHRRNYYLSRTKRMRDWDEDEHNWRYCARCKNSLRERNEWSQNQPADTASFSRPSRPDCDNPLATKSVAADTNDTAPPMKECVTALAPKLSEARTYLPVHGSDGNYDGKRSGLKTTREASLHTADAKSMSTGRESWDRSFSDLSVSEAAHKFASEPSITAREPDLHTAKRKISTARLAFSPVRTGKSTLAPTSSTRVISEPAQMSTAYTSSGPLKAPWESLHNAMAAPWNEQPESGFSLDSAMILTSNADFTTSGTGPRTARSLSERGFGHGHASLFGKSGRVFHDIHTAKRARSLSHVSDGANFKTNQSSPYSGSQPVSERSSFYLPRSDRGSSSMNLSSLVTGSNGATPEVYNKMLRNAIFAPVGPETRRSPNQNNSSAAMTLRAYSTSTASRNARTSRRSSSCATARAKNEPQSNDKWKSSHNAGSIMQASGRDTKDIMERQPYMERYNVSTECPSPQSSSRVTVTSPQPYKHTRTHKPNGKSSTGSTAKTYSPVQSDCHITGNVFIECPHDTVREQLHGSLSLADMRSMRAAPSLSVNRFGYNAVSNESSTTGTTFTVSDSRSSHTGYSSTTGSRSGHSDDMKYGVRSANLIFSPLDAPESQHGQSESGQTSSQQVFVPLRERHDVENLLLPTMHYQGMSRQDCPAIPVRKSSFTKSFRTAKAKTPSSWQQTTPRPPQKSSRRDRFPSVEGGISTVRQRSSRSSLQRSSLKEGLLNRTSASGKFAHWKRTSSGPPQRISRQTRFGISEIEREISTARQRSSSKSSFHSSHEDHLVDHFPMSESVLSQASLQARDSCPNSAKLASRMPAAWKRAVPNFAEGRDDISWILRTARARSSDVLAVADNDSHVSYGKIFWNGIKSTTSRKCSYPGSATAALDKLSLWQRVTSEPQPRSSRLGRFCDTSISSNLRATRSSSSLLLTKGGILWKRTKSEPSLKVTRWYRFSPHPANAVPNMLSLWQRITSEPRRRSSRFERFRHSLMSSLRTAQEGSTDALVLNGTYWERTSSLTPLRVSKEERFGTSEFTPSSCRSQDQSIPKLISQDTGARRILWQQTTSYLPRRLSREDRFFGNNSTMSLPAARQQLSERSVCVSESHESMDNTREGAYFLSKTPYSIDGSTQERVERTVLWQRTVARAPSRLLRTERFERRASAGLHVTDSAEISERSEAEQSDFCNRDVELRKDTTEQTEQLLSGLERFRKPNPNVLDGSYLWERLVPERFKLDMEFKSRALFNSTGSRTTRRERFGVE